MEKDINILIVDEDHSFYDLLENSSRLDKYTIFSSDSFADILKPIKSNSIGIVILDIKRDMDKGLTAIKELKKFDSLLDIIVIGDPLPSEDIMELINQGAKDFLDKPLQVSVIDQLIQEIIDKKNLRRETYQLEKKLEKKYVYQGIIGKSPYMLEIFSLIEKVARHFSSILITGETGTGKELIAGAIHKISNTKNANLVICDCTSIPSSLFESELFGYLKGAFTGADKNKAGLFEEAHNGIIFFDELAEIPVAIQSKLLRVLEYNQFRPLGSNQIKKVDVKLIAATSRDLKTSMERGDFREDLFHRINKVHIHLPPLRTRREDIPLLVRHFLNLFRRKISKEIKGVSRQVQKTFLNYEWPGNIRELQNVLESACLITKKEFIDMTDLPKYLQDTVPYRTQMPVIDRKNLFTLNGLEKEYIQHLVKITGKNLRKTASILNISRTTLYNKLKKYNIPH